MENTCIKQLESFEELVVLFVQKEKNMLEKICEDLYYDKNFIFYISVIIHLMCEDEENYIKILLHLVIYNPNFDVRYLHYISNYSFLKKVTVMFKPYKKAFIKYNNYHKWSLSD